MCYEVFWDFVHPSFPEKRMKGSIEVESKWLAEELVRKSNRDFGEGTHKMRKKENENSSF